MKLTVLVDNNTLIDQYYYGEPGVCYYIEDEDIKLLNTIDYFKQNKVAELYPCHCVSFKAKSAIHQAIPIHEVGVGLTLEI